MIERGQTIPDIPVRHVVGETVTETSSRNILGSGRVVLFTIPGAFTPTCQNQHLKGFLETLPKLHRAGVDRVVCATVNDHHVVKAWVKAMDAGKIEFIADGSGNFAEAMGLAKDYSASNMGMRSSRAALILSDGAVHYRFIEDAPGVTGSGAPAILMALEAERA